MGVTTGGSIGATSAKTLEECVFEIDAIADAALSVRKDVIVLCHGGPIAMPADAEFILQNAEHCHGFYGASSMERLPVEIALTEQTQEVQGDRVRRRIERRAGANGARAGGRTMARQIRDRQGDRSRRCSTGASSAG